MNNSYRELRITGSCNNTRAEKLFNKYDVGHDNIMLYFREKQRGCVKYTVDPTRISVIYDGVSEDNFPPPAP